MLVRSRRVLPGVEIKRIKVVTEKNSFLLDPFGFFPGLIKMACTWSLAEMTEMSFCWMLDLPPTSLAWDSLVRLAVNQGVADFCLQ